MELPWSMYVGAMRVWYCVKCQRAVILLRLYLGAVPHDARIVLFTVGADEAELHRSHCMYMYNGALVANRFGSGLCEGCVRMIQDAFMSRVSAANDSSWSSSMVFA